MIIAIDGTGEANDSKYEKEMKGSFCKQLWEQGARYFRGPTLAGTETARIAQQAAIAVITGRRGEATGEPVVFAGYSRGGCAAILAAHTLKENGINIDSMFLFDAVDMQASSFNVTQIIPDNVRYVAHARGTRSIVFRMKYPNMSRSYFYNTGRWLWGTGEIETEWFWGTHGAMGNVGWWKEVPEDRPCAVAVTAWMNKRLAKRGLDSVTLKSA